MAYANSLHTFHGEGGWLRYKLTNIIMAVKADERKKADDRSPHG